MLDKSPDAIFEHTSLDAPFPRFRGKQGGLATAAEDLAAEVGQDGLDIIPAATLQSRSLSTRRLIAREAGAEVGMRRTLSKCCGRPTDRRIVIMPLTW